MSAPPISNAGNTEPCLSAASPRREGLKLPSPLPNAIPELLEQAGRRFSNRTALSWQPDGILSYLALHELSGDLARQLANLGVRETDRVAVVLNSAVDFHVAFLAVCSQGVFCPFNPDYTEREFEDFFRRMNIRYVVVRETAVHRAIRAADRLEIPTIHLTGQLPSGLKFKGERKAADSNSHDGADDSGVAIVLHTSGTTSEPKIVPLTHANLMISASNMARSLLLGPEDSCLNFLPPFHVGALVDLVLAPLLSGGTVAIGQNSDPESIFEQLLERQPTWFQAVPTMLHALLRHRSSLAEQYFKEASPRKLRLIRSVSAALPEPWLVGVEERFDVPVIEIYGMTETSGVVCSNPIDARKVGSVGIPIGQEVAVVTKEGNPAPAGRPGEVVVKGRNVFSGYEVGSDSLQTEDQFFIGDWFRTGDEGYLDDDGYLFLIGRTKEIINRGGEKISPLEVDQVAMAHPDVREAGSFAVSHPSLGEDIALAVVPEHDQINLRSLQSFLSDRLAYFKVPRTVHLVESLPRNRSGKLLRHELFKRFEKPAGKSPNKEPAAPTTRLGKKIAEIWSSALEVKRITTGDDFFELGGDSLIAKGMLTQLQNELECEIHVAALFEHPTLGEFESYLTDRLAEPKQQPATRSPESDQGLPGEVQKQLNAFLSAWRGQRQSSNSLLTGLNTLGGRPPLFWCGQGAHEVQRLSDALGNNQPVYGMRSLWRVEGRKKSHNRILASLYVNEIIAIQPSGDLFVGGFCEGGSIAFLIAEELQRRNRKVALLCLHDRFVPGTYHGRAAFFFGKPSKETPYGHFLEPEKGWYQYYKGPVSLYQLDMAHNYLNEELPDLGRHILHEMDCAMEGRPSDNVIELQSRATTPLPDEAYQAKLSVDSALPRLMSPGESRTVTVHVTNDSPVPWLPSARSGIVLSNRWFNRDGAPRSNVDGRSTFEHTVHPGETIVLPLTIRVPQKAGSRRLIIDLADEGVTWFEDRGSSPFAASMRVFPGAGFLARLIP